MRIQNLCSEGVAEVPAERQPFHREAEGAEVLVGRQPGHLEAVVVGVLVEEPQHWMAEAMEEPGEAPGVRSRQAKGVVPVGLGMKAKVAAAEQQGL